MKRNLYLIIVLAVISCNISRKTAYNPAKKFSPSELKEDLAILQKVLQANHPSLYWYSPADSINQFFFSTYRSLNDSLTEQQFRRKVSWAVSKIRCGHTSVGPSKKYANYYSKHRQKSFPFLLKVWRDSAAVISNLLKDSIIKPGTVITQVNGVPVAQLVDSMCHLISSDGYSNIFKYQLLSFNFPVFYRYAFGVPRSYNVQYIDSHGQLRHRTYPNVLDTLASAVNNESLLPHFLTRKQFRQYKLDNARKLEVDTALNAALLSINTFSKGKLIRFFRHSFKTIRHQKIKNVIIDLRLNTGGSVIACTRLSQYLINRPFHVSDTVSAFSRSFKYKKYIKPWFIYWLNTHISGRRMKDGKIHFRYFEKHLFKPKRKDHFKGNIYLLTGGYTFSAATLVASNLKGQANVKIVGEETGGGSYGNSAMLLSKIVLPNTSISVTLPLFRMVLNANRLKTGRGVLPDIEVRPSSSSIKTGVDAKLERVKALIKQQ